MRPTVIGLLLAGLALGALVFGALLQPPDRDLFPPPDGPEYFAGAVSLVDHGDYSIELAGVRLPPRYPPGYSVLMLPFLRLGVEPVLAPFVVNRVAALALLTLVFAMPWLRRLHVAAGLAALLLVTTPGFLILARSPMADMPSMLLVTAANWCLVRYAETGRLRLGSLGALILGLSMTVRLSNVLFAPLVLAAWYSARELQGRGRLRHCVSLAAAGVLGALPLLLYNTVQFGHPLASGYSMWVPDRASFLSAFQFENLLPNLRCLTREVLQSEWKYTVATAYGGGSYFGPALALLALLCLWLRPPRRHLVPIALAMAGYAVVMLFYFFQDARFFLQLLPATAVFVAVRLHQLQSQPPRTALKLGLGLLMLLHVFGVPGSGAVADVLPMLRPAATPPAPCHAMLQQLAAEPPGLLLCSFSPPYARAILGAPWIVAPAQDDHAYRANATAFVYGTAQRQAQMQAAASEGRPIYLAADQGFAMLLQRIPPPDATSWQVMHREGDAGIARIEPVR